MISEWISAFGLGAIEGSLVIVCHSVLSVRWHVVCPLEVSMAVVLRPSTRHPLSELLGRQDPDSLQLLPGMEPVAMLMENQARAHRLEGGCNCVTTSTYTRHKFESTDFALDIKKNDLITVHTFYDDSKIL